MADRTVRDTNTQFGTRAIGSLAEWRSFSAWLRRHARVSLGLLPAPAPASLNPRFLGRWEGGGYICEKVAFESLPGFFVTGNLFRRADAGESIADRPGILCPHGHWAAGRLHDYDPRGSVVARCVNLALQGATVFSWDMIGYNDCCQLTHREFEGDKPWGLSLMGLQTWNGICSIDFLQSLPEVDASRIGVTGASGGGTQTFALMAVDERVAAAAPICMISYHMQGGCLCENAPLLRQHATNVDLARLFAPGPLFLGSCTGDWTKNTPEVELPAIAQVYALLGAEDQLAGRHVDAGHNYNQELREAVYGFFNYAFYGADSAAPVKEREFPRPPLRDQMVWWGCEAPQPLSSAGLKEAWTARSRAALDACLATASTARTALAPLLAHVLGIGPDGALCEDTAACRGVSVQDEGDALVVRPAPGVDMGEPDSAFYDTYNLPPVCARVHEILQVVESAGDPVQIVGEGAAGLWCLLAAAVNSNVGVLDVDLAGVDPDADATWTELLPVPAIRQVGGADMLLALVSDRQVTVRHAGDGLGKLIERWLPR